jgi:hypothetical protein
MWRGRRKTLQTRHPAWNRTQGTQNAQTHPLKKAIHPDLLRRYFSKVLDLHGAVQKYTGAGKVLRVSC